MRTLGYIVCDRKIKDIDGFVEQVDDISLADSTKPILIVGWKKAKTLEGYTSILDKQLSDNMFWTFSKTESRSDFEEDLELFYNIIYNNILNKINYYYINIFKLKYNKIKKLYNIIYSKEFKNIYISNNIVYIPYDKDKILGRIKSFPNNRVYEDNDKFIFKLSKRLGNKKYAIPYFISN